MQDTVTILCLGDIVGRPGRRALDKFLAPLRAALGVDLVIANGENAAGGIGLTTQSMRELFAAGVDVLTSGNHIWRHKEIFPALHSEKRLLRPCNYGKGVPGRGLCVFSLPDGTRLAVLNLLGRVFMDPVHCPFAAADEALAELEQEGGAACIIVDFHAEASSEKRAMAHYLDGRVSAVLGTHTHVQTADALVSGLGTASLTDLGMCGVEESSVIGMAKEKVVKRFTTGLPQPFIPAKGEGGLNGALLEVDKKSGKALSIRLVRDKASPVISGMQ